MESTKGSTPRVADFDPKVESQGKWQYIFSDLLPELKDAMDKAGHHVSCPYHGGEDGFRLFKDFHTTGGGYCNTCGPKSNGFAVLAWLKGYAFKDAVREVSQWIRGDNSVPAPIRRPVIAAPKPEDYSKAHDYISKVWAASKPIKGTPAERYLLNRGIPADCIPASLRFHPGLKYIHGKEKQDLGTFPCLLAPIKNKSGGIMSVHRIFLTPDGQKAPVPDAKKMMPKCGYLGGSAIKMFTPGEVLGLAEGIETAAAVRAGTGMPVWPCVSAVLMELVDIPETVQHVVIWADLDRSGRGAEAAKVIGERVAALGKTFEICMPPGPIPETEKGVDWLNIWNTLGIAGFPVHLQRKVAA